MKKTKERLLPVIFIVYIVSLAILIFPYYQAKQQWFAYISIVSGSVVLAVLLFLLFKKRKKDKKRN